MKVFVYSQLRSTKEHELTTWWGEWAHVIQNLGTEHKGKHHEESSGQVLYSVFMCTFLKKID